MARIELTVDGDKVSDDVEPGCCSCSTSARSSARPAR